MAGLIKAIVFLALIAGVGFGAKIFYFDPQKAQTELQDTKRDVSKLIDAGEYKKALTTCDKLQKKSPKMKKFCNGRRYEIYKGLGEREWKAMMSNESAASQAERTSLAKQKELLDLALTNSANCIDAVEQLENYGELKRVHQSWVVTAYGFRYQKMKKSEEKLKYLAAQKRQKELISTKKEKKD